MPVAPTSRRTRTGNGASKTSAVDRLADQLASGLSITNAKGKEKAQTPVLSAERQRVAAMRSVNSASQSLASIIASGWKRSTGDSPRKLTEAKSAATSAAIHIASLRELCPGDIDVERAAMSVLGKLVALDMYDAALLSLPEMHSSLCRLLSVTIPLKSNSSDKLHLITIPIPAISTSIEPALLTLISNYFMYALVVITSTYFPPSKSTLRPSKLPTDFLTHLEDTLRREFTLISWMPFFQRLPPKHMDFILTRIYSVLTKSIPAELMQSNNSSAFFIRMHGLCCLAYTSPGTVGSPDVFWEHPTKYAAVYMKSLLSEQPSSSDVQQQAANTLVQAFSHLVSIAEMKQDSAEFLKGKGFLAFCEYWIELANRNGNTSVLDKIIGLIHRASPRKDVGQSQSNTEILKPGDKTEPTSPPLKMDRVHFCANLARATASLDKPDEGSLRDALDSATALLDEAVKNLRRDADISWMEGKGDRAMERLRRAAVKIIEATPGDSDAQFKDVSDICSLLELIVNVLEQVIRVKPSKNSLTQALDTLFVLSRSRLDVLNIRTYVPVHKHLARAATLVELGKDGLTGFDEANCVRCISGAFHNAGGTLYQSERHASAISFFKDGCELGSKALSLRSRSGSEGDDREDGWTQLSNQLYRRWQLLGLCYAKIGDRKPAYEAFVQCIRTFPFLASDFVPRSGTTSLSALFACSPAIKELCSIVDKATYQGVCDLMLCHPDVSLRFGALDDPSIVGALLERQLECLEPHLTKKCVQTVAAGLLRDATEVYACAGMPLRRARVLIKSLIFAYHCGLDVISQIGMPDAIVVDILALVSEHPTKDVGLAMYSSQYRAMAHIWQAMHAHRRADPQQMVLIIEGSNAACEILRAYLQSGTDVKVSRKATPKQPSARKVTKAVSSTRRTTAKKTPAKTPTTPKPRQRKALEDVPLNAATPAETADQSSTANVALEDVERLLDALQSLVHILGVLSLLVPRVNALDIMRRISQCSIGSSCDRYVWASAQLAHDYVSLGKMKRANKIFNQLSSTVQAGQVSFDVAITFFLRFAESRAVLDDIAQSSELYQSALDLSDNLKEDKTLPPLELHSLIQSCTDDNATYLDGLLQSLRQWNRAFDALSRLQPPSSKRKPHDEADPFADPIASRTSGEASSNPGKKDFSRREAMNELGWRISEGLILTLFALCDGYAMQGSAREAEFFAQQAEDLAQSLNAPAMMARALIRKAELQLHQGKLEEGQESLTTALQLICDDSSVDLADIHRLHGQFSEDNADADYQLAAEILEQLDKTFGLFDGVAFGPRRSTGAELMVPGLLTKLLRNRIWHLRDDNGEQSTELLEKFMCLSYNSQTKAEENSLLAKLALYGVYKRFRADMFLSSLTESTIALPLGTTGADMPTLSGTSLEISRCLETAARLFGDNLKLTTHNGDVSHVREAAIKLALIRAFQTSLGKSGTDGPLLVANLLDASSAITLRREMYEAILHKFSAAVSDDCRWPLMSASRTAQISSRPVLRRPFTSDVSEDEPDEAESSLKDYWNHVQQRYLSRSVDIPTLSTCQMTSLPSTWSIVHMCVTEDKGTLFVTRQYGGDVRDRDLVFCVPLKGRRDGEGSEEHLTFEDAITEFQDIIRASNETTKAAVNIKPNDDDAKSKWWKERASLDTRLRELLQNIEFCWLGAFKTILSPCPRLSTEEITHLRSLFDKAFQRGLHLQDKKTKQKAIGHRKIASDYQTPNRVTLDDTLMECFSTLSPQCQDEELEDLVYFMLDLYQFHGVSVAIAEIDVTQVVVDLRSALEDHASRRSKKARNVPPQDEHIFLVLDRDIQGLPWENIPILRGRSTSRIPSVEFLLDRVEFSRRQWKPPCRPSAESHVDRAFIDPRKGYYLLNPSGDLNRTEGRFKEWAEGMESAGWLGIVGRPPSEQQFLNALQDRDIVVYFGHGGGEQYIRSHRIRHLPRCAAVMLWGCSSGFLREMGTFDRVGAPYNYMIAGCPTLVANLWDVTDRDIDKFSQSVFDKLRLTRDCVQGWTVESMMDPERTSLVAAVAQSRDVCKLKYLTGAAPVVYGIPFYL
ncbi:cysteine peptidase C50 [Armillaria luteobubalina]|uniref:separase n=1 Tax=Armillaria luteobubalina TaxID=153913 RepID=A0AA39UMR8_9AGAR|nr:cysteine peptidase C50 [Armillaria luteobubalina]